MARQHQPVLAGIGRRKIITGAAAVSLAAVLGNPKLTLAAAETLTEVAITTNTGGIKVQSALARPDGEGPWPGILLVHEWWGLNSQIKAVAADLARQGYLALAVDLYEGRVATTPDEARSYMGKVEKDEATDTLVSWAKWLAEQSECSGRLGSVGWCFGGGWSLNAGIVAPINGVVIYYGNVQRSAAELASLNAPVLGHFATRDGWINRDMVTAFEAEMKTAGKPFTTHWYEADHAFANPSSHGYDSADANLAWQRTLEFYGSVL